MDQFNRSIPITFLAGALFFIAEASAAPGHTRLIDSAIEQSFELHPDHPQFLNIVLALPNGTEITPEWIALRQSKLIELLGDDFSVVYRYRHVPALSGYLHAEGWPRLRDSSLIQAAGRDKTSKGQLNSSVPFIHADDVHALGFTGEGITVAVIDSGIDSDHPDLIGDIAPGGWHFLDQGLDQGPGAEDTNGHGTAVSAIITSSGNVAGVGVAPDAHILPIEVLDSTGQGHSSDIVAGIDYAVSVRDSHADLRIINMSLGEGLFTDCPCDASSADTMLFAFALDAARAAGMIPIVSSGNAISCTSMRRPACTSAAVSVARVSETGTTGTVSGTSQSACNQLAAPGSVLTSDVGGGVLFGTGTSAAAPHVSGSLALLRERARLFGVPLDPDAMETLLLSTAAPANSSCSVTPPRTVNALALINALPLTPVEFIRGDADGDGAVIPIGDAISVLNYLFSIPGGASIACLDAADLDDSGGVDIGDAIFVLNYGFAMGSPPPPPPAFFSSLKAT